MPKAIHGHILQRLLGIITFVPSGFVTTSVGSTGVVGIVDEPDAIIYPLFDHKDLSSKEEPRR